jgi:hypothetical protein
MNVFSFYAFWQLTLLAFKYEAVTDMSMLLNSIYYLVVGHQQDENIRY